MKNEHFNNLVALSEAMIDIVDRDDIDDTTFGEISLAIDPCLKMLDNHCDSLVRESDGEVKTVELMYDQLDDPDFIILPGEAETVIRRKRIYIRVSRRFAKLLKARSKKAAHSVIERIVGGLLDGEPFFGWDDEEEEDCCDKVAIAKELFGCFKKFRDTDFGIEDNIHLLPLSVCYSICSAQVDLLEGKAESLDAELEGEDADEYIELMSMMDEIKSEALAFKKEHPDAPMKPFGIEDDDSDEDSGDEEE